MLTATTYCEIKSAISSHLFRFGTLPMMTFFTERLRPTGTTEIQKCRISIRFVTELYENKTHLLIVDKFTVAKLMDGNIF